MKRLDQVEEIFCGVALFATTVILFLNVILRYGFGSSTSWAEELIKYIMIWITFIGASICVRKGLHVNIDFLLGYLPPKGKKTAALIVCSIALCFTMLMTYYGFQTIQFTIQTAQVSPALQIPMWIPYLAIPLGFALMSLRFAQKWVEMIKNIADHTEMIGGK